MVWGTDFVFSAGGNKIWHGPLINHRLVQGDGLRFGETTRCLDRWFKPNDIQYCNNTMEKKASETPILGGKVRLSAIVFCCFDCWLYTTFFYLFIFLRTVLPYLALWNASLHVLYRTQHTQVFLHTWHGQRRLQNVGGAWIAQNGTRLSDASKKKKHALLQCDKWWEIYS